MSHAYRHNPSKSSTAAIATANERNVFSAPAMALTTLIISVVLTLLAQAGWLPLT